MKFNKNTFTSGTVGETAAGVSMRQYQQTVFFTSNDNLSSSFCPGFQSVSPSIEMKYKQQKVGRDLFFTGRLANGTPVLASQFLSCCT